MFTDVTIPVKPVAVLQIQAAAPRDAAGPGGPESARAAGAPTSAASVRHTTS
jgi:hypothetical protein